MGELLYDLGISCESSILNAYVKKKFFNTSRIIKLKESSWSNVFLVTCLTSSKRFILKCSVNSSSLAHEHAALLFLKGKGITHIPRVVAYEKFEAFYVLSLNYIENGDSITLEGQRRLAVQIAAIHAIRSRRRVDGLEQVRKILSDTACLVGYLDQPGLLSAHRKGKALIQRFNELIEQNKRHFQGRECLVFINGDLGDDAIYSFKGKINIIDWHVSGFGDNAWDIARLFFNNSKSINRKFFLKEYLTCMDDSHFMKRFKVYWPLNKLFTMLYFFLRSEWCAVPEQYATKALLEENLDLLFK